MKNRILYAVAFAFLAIIWQRCETGDLLGGWRESFAAMSGFAIALLVLPQVSLTKIRNHKTAHIIWTAVWLVGLVPGILIGRRLVPYTNILVTCILEIVLWGYLVIYTAFEVKNGESSIKRIRPVFMILWLLMEFWMIISRSDYLWPLGFAVIFGVFYLTNYSRSEEIAIMRGMNEGLILSFFLLQGWSLLYRPWDNYRYQMAFTNSSQTALFYVLVLAAVLAKLVELVRAKAHILLRIAYVFLAGIVLGFMMLPAARMGWIMSVGLVGLYSIMYSMLREKKYVIRVCMVFLALTIACTPLCFAMARYIPPLRHHPVWFVGEYSEEKVHSYDPWNSAKYTDWSEFIGNSFWRIKETMEMLGISDAGPFAITAHAAESDVPAEGEPGYEEWANSLPYDIEAAGDGTKSRLQLFSYCIKRMNMLGVPLEQQPVWISHYFFAYHCHNLILQMGTDFGWPVLILFAILLGWAVVYEVIRILKEGPSGESAAALLQLMVPAVFGMVEYCWGHGSLVFVLLYVIWRNTAVRSEEEA